MGYRRTPRSRSPRQRRNMRQHPEIVAAARAAQVAMLARCDDRTGGQLYPHGWEPAPPEVQDEVDDATAGRWHSPATARKAIARLVAWNA